MLFSIHFQFQRIRLGLSNLGKVTSSKSLLLQPANPFIQRMKLWGIHTSAVSEATCGIRIFLPDYLFKAGNTMITV